MTWFQRFWVGLQTLFDRGRQGQRLKDEVQFHLDQQIAENIAAGMHPQAVDDVLCTPLHGDHVGWKTPRRDGRWVPMFPNATYIISRKEWEHWETVHHATPLEHLADSVLPIVEAGLATFVANDYALNDEVWLEPTPGHTPDHVSVHLASNGAHAVITGDMIHSPVQCAEPTWIPRPDFDRALAHQTRQAFRFAYEYEENQDRAAAITFPI